MNFPFLPPLTFPSLSFLPISRFYNSTTVTETIVCSVRCLPPAWLAVAILIRPVVPGAENAVEKTRGCACKFSRCCLYLCASTATTATTTRAITIRRRAISTTNQRRRTRVHKHLTQCALLLLLLLMLLLSLLLLLLLLLMLSSTTAQ